MISLVLMIRLISSIKRELTHTVKSLSVEVNILFRVALTLFANQRVISIIGVVCIACRSTSAIT